MKLLINHATVAALSILIGAIGGSIVVAIAFFLIMAEGFPRHQIGEE